MPLADAGPALSPLHVVVPMRTLGGGKARLGEVLDAEEREELVLGMLRHTLVVLDGWPACAAIHLVSPDPQLLETALEVRVRRHLQAGEGLNAGIRLGRDAAADEGAAALLVLPGDLPHLEVEALDRVVLAADATVAAAQGGPVVVVVAADARGGTNALLLRPVDVIEPHFGVASLEAHLRAAALADAAVQVVADPVLGFDLDTAEDLERVDPIRLRALVDLGREALEARLA